MERSEYSVLEVTPRANRVLLPNPEPTTYRQGQGTFEVGVTGELDDQSSVCSEGSFSEKTEKVGGCAEGCVR